jgi:hypothetical protein
VERTAWRHDNLRGATPRDQDSSTSINESAVLFYFCGEGPRSRCYGRTVVLRLIVQPCDEDEEKGDQFFSFFQVMEHRWNGIDRGKPKYSGGKPCPSATLSTTNSTWTDPESNIRSPLNYNETNIVTFKR